MKIVEDLLPRNCWGPPRGKTFFIVLHATAGSTYAGAKLAYQQRNVSAHFTIDPDGTIYRNVPEDAVAYHAGVSQWGRFGHPSTGINSLNPWSLGIELVHPNEMSFGWSPQQIEACKALVVHLAKRYSVPWNHILTHAMISPGRKTDPVGATWYHDILEAVRPSRQRILLFDGSDWQDVSGQRVNQAGLTVNAEGDTVWIRGR